MPTPNIYPLSPQPPVLVISILFGLLCFGIVNTESHAAEDEPAWIAGDHHIHSRFSVGWDMTKVPPAPMLGGDAIYPIPMNALMARHFGLAWMVATDHGGPNHSHVSLERTYPELQLSRELVPEVMQFFGMEFDTPGADHSSLIVPNTHDEAKHLVSIESQFSKREPWPVDPSWDTEPRMLEALQAMQRLPEPPVLIAHHPSRSATAARASGLVHPAELRAWNKSAPGIAVGMEGSPGHQAGGLNPDGSANPKGARGAYGAYPTLGGFDQMTAVVGGFWDSMLGEGRDWWITANSDSHQHVSEGGTDFWPGEYSKTYVWADRNYAAILDGIRGGRIFVTTGDLISELHVTATAGAQQAGIGGTLQVPAESPVEITIRFLDPQVPNHHGDYPGVQRVDLIMGEIREHVTDVTTDSHPSTKIVARFTEQDWRRVGAYNEIHYTLEELEADMFIRVRGTNTNQLEPDLDTLGENPWDDLWLYSNPVRLRLPH